MRRTGLLIVGAMLATGAGLAMASPASAAPGTTAGHPHHPYYNNHHRHHHHNFYDGYWGNGYGYGDNGWWGPCDD